VDLARYAALFVAESREHLQACNQLLLAWERDPASREPVDGLFRALHSIKGMAATMGFTPLAELAHRGENLLDAVRSEKLTVKVEHFELLFRTVDALESGVEAAAAGRPMPRDAESLMKALDASVKRPPSRKGTGRQSVGEPAQAPGRALAEPPGHLPSGMGVPLAVTLAIQPAAMLKGARALLALRKVEALGEVSRVRPPVNELEREDFDGKVTFQLRTAVAPAEVDAALRSAGDVASVAIDLAGDEQPVDAAAFRQIRIDLARLDALMKLAGELVVARNRLLELARDQGHPELSQLGERISRLVGAVQGEVLEARLTPVHEVFERFPRVVRDLARDLGKQVRLVVEGGDIELDRAVLDELADPLVHLVRNAVDHGIELPRERTRAGKPAEGTVRLVAVRERSTVAIRVADDGRGIDRARILAKARAEGTVDQGTEELGDEQLLRVLSRAGFSTAVVVSDVSGRGVGVDVVMTRIRALGGSVTLESTPGTGTTFVLRVPLTLAILRSMLVEVGGERYVLPLTYVRETVEYSQVPKAILGDREALLIRNQPVPMVDLADLLVTVPAGQPGHAPARHGRRPAVILQVGERHLALVVDALLGQQEIVVEPFDAPVGMPGWFSGATILPDGSPALIVDAAALV
jgi:two-component system chemotaxis sensor kinase CheA